MIAFDSAGSRIDLFQSKLLSGSQIQAKKKREPSKERPIKEYERHTLEACIPVFQALEALLPEGEEVQLFPSNFLINETFFLPPPNPPNFFQPPPTTTWFHARRGRLSPKPGNGGETRLRKKQKQERKKSQSPNYPRRKMNWTITRGFRLAIRLPKKVTGEEAD